MNPDKRQLIMALRKASHSQGQLWRSIADELGRVQRNSRVVNLSRINRHTKPDETVVVPGKVLASGTLDHAVHVAAYSFSKSAAEMITKSKGSVLTIPQLMKKHPDGKDVRILG